ncbi:MAG: phosphatidylserine decarboxylase family protein [Marinilabiliaceae bacterium]|nr:phosphatidylserine decarboxylase family protein [Marinilabiliaceae bacterium]
MTIHKEGFGTIAVVFILLLMVNAFAGYLSDWDSNVIKITSIPSLIVLVLVINFFRSPKRDAVLNEKAVISPADGKIVAIEEVEETEYLKTKCIQVSVFMSVFNVHINWFPISGVVKYSKHHNGRFLAAYLPKSSTENERTTVVVEAKNGQQILFRQVAGAMARRIVCYAKEGETVKQSAQTGFIKFGSRVDVYFPIGSQIDVKLGQKVSGSQTILGLID